ncbi:unnamed protein product, partial [Musa banksii]
IFYPSRNIIVAILGLYNQPWHPRGRRRLENIRSNRRDDGLPHARPQGLRPSRHTQAHPLRH